MDPLAPRWYHQLYVELQFLLPQHLLSRLIGWLTHRRWGWVKTRAIELFIRWFQVDMSEASEPDPASYPHFNAFFTRALRPEARPTLGSPRDLVSPVDALLSAHGELTGDRLIQAKGQEFSLASLLGGSDDWSRRFSGGQFLTFYLSPQDYHRIHLPLDGTVREIRHIPGRLFSVNALTAHRVPGLYARNERAVCLFETPYGPLALVLVAAIFVGGIETRWTGPLDHPRSGIAVYRPAPEPAWTERGSEIGRFNMGSTVILVLPPGMITLEPSLVSGVKVKTGQPLGTVITA